MKMWFTKSFKNESIIPSNISFEERPEGKGRKLYLPNQKW
jgi:hypothetical protein